MSNYVTLSFSGGKDSTAMLLHMIELGEHIDEVLNIDTGMEFPAMYAHIAKVRNIVEANGIKYTTLRADHSFEWYLLEKPIKSKKYGDHTGYGWPAPMCRWCTKHMKTEIIDKYLKKLRENYTVTQCIGLACDEFKRLERPNNKRAGHRHPLVEWGWSEEDCLDYCYSKGFDWGGLYRQFSRVSCWCCPLAAISELRTLWKNYPELWHQLEEWENLMKNPKIGHKFTFKEDMSVFDLAKRFIREDEAERFQTKLTQFCEVGQ